MQAKITKTRVEAMASESIIADEEVKGFVARRLASGVITYGFRYRDKITGKQRWIGLGIHGKITAESARGLAKKRAGEVADMRDPVAERETARKEAARAARAERNTVDAILDVFVARHVKNLRSADQIERAFNVYVRPRIGDKSIYEVTRRDVVEMLDNIEDDNGPVMADRVLAHVRKAFNWQAARDDNFSPPIVRGMARTKPRERARIRVLADDEIRDVWSALDGSDVPEAFRHLVRALLLTAQRRSEVSNMRWEEIDGDMWTIPAERYKTGVPNFVSLTDATRSVLGAENRKRGKEGEKKRGFVFSTDGGKRAFSGFSKAKRALDKAIAGTRKAEGRKPMPRWTLHDLRRTARSLMSRAGVPSEHAERVLGHVIPGVEGVYDCHSYADEKREALKRLAGIVNLILHPPADNIVQLGR